jgi:hypothetical protein
VLLLLLMVLVPATLLLVTQLGLGLGLGLGAPSPNWDKSNPPAIPKASPSSFDVSLILSIGVSSEDSSDAVLSKEPPLVSMALMTWIDI